MSILHLVRHGQASFGADDYDNLSPTGIQQSIELGKALAKQQSTFDYVIVGPHRRHMQTFEGIKEGYASKNLPTPIMNNDFAENQLMEIAEYFIPQILNTTKTTKQIFNECEPAVSYTHLTLPTILRV